MTSRLLAACSFVAISGVGLAAQQPQPATPQPQMPPAQQTPPAQQAPPSQPAQRPPATEPATRQSSPSADMARTATTMTGCLKTWDSRTMAPATGAGSGAGSAAAATTATASSQYVLTNIDRTGAAARTGASSFLLKTSDANVSFSQHVNHKVEVTGTVTDSGAGMSTADKPTGDKPTADRDAAATGRPSAGDMKLPTLDVTSLKMISPSCGTGSN